MAQELSDKIEAFLKENNVAAVVSFSGGSDNEGEKVNQIIEESIGQLRNYPIAILTGGTSWGIPRTATEVAKDYGMKTIGVLPERGTKYSLGNLLDLEIVIPPRYGISEYGDESEIFAKCSNGMYLIGGSNGTAIEFYHTMKINERRLDPKYNEQPIYIAPISGLGGFSDNVNNYILKDILRQLLPENKITTGLEASKFLLGKLNFS